MSGLPANVSIQTASLYGNATLGGSNSITRYNLGTDVQVRYMVSTGKIEVTKGGSTFASFDFSELNSDLSGTGLAVFSRGNVPIINVPSEILELHLPSIGGVPLSYTRFGTYLNIKANILNINSSKIDPIAAFVFGQPTAARPTTGSATYTADLFGAVALLAGQDTQLFTLGNGHGSATFSADFAGNTVSTLISLDADGRDFGDLTGSGTIVSGSPAFSGTLSGSANGGFTGAFFGPSAVEMGYVFNAQGTAGSQTFLTYGNVFGVKAPPPP